MAGGGGAWAGEWVVCLGSEAEDMQAQDPATSSCPPGPILGRDPKPFAPWPPGHSPVLEAARPCGGPRGWWAHILLPRADKGASLLPGGLWLYVRRNGAASPPGWCGHREAIRELGSNKRSRAPWTWGNPDHRALPRGLGLLPALWSRLGFRRDHHPQGPMAQPWDVEETRVEARLQAS